MAEIDWKARHDDLAAAVAALADGWVCDDPGCDREGGNYIRAAVANPAAVLAERDARVKAEAWDEGLKEGWRDVGRPFSAQARNPYREGQA